MPVTTLEQVMERLEDLADARSLEINTRHGDDHAVNLGKLRALAKELKSERDLIDPLWATDDSAAKLLAILISKPKDLSVSQVDSMLRSARTPKVQDWLVNYVAKKHPAAEEMRLLWFDDPDPAVASAGWELTVDRVVKNPTGVDIKGLLDTIESQMADAPKNLQWSMNNCLGNIGIEHEEFRARALYIGEQLGVLKDYPTPPNCTSPYAPLWINEIVRRRAATKR